MRELVTHTPEGVRDIYGEALDLQSAAEDRIEAVMNERGYRRIRTPALEFCDVFADDTSETGEMFRYQDRDGETLILRPDFTPGIARCAVKYFLEDDKPARLSYRGSVFNNRRSLSGKLREETQIGAELYNDPSVRADAEIISLAVDSLTAAGLKDVRISVGHMDYFYGFCEEAGLGEPAKDDLLDAVCDRNVKKAVRVLDEYSVSGQVREKLLSIADFLSDDQDLEEMYASATNDRSRNAVRRLMDLSGELDRAGVSAHVTFDAGLLNRYRYYTGVVFRAYVSGIGEPVARGGRYDDLLARFGKDAPAVGFMALTDDLASALTAGDDEYLTIALGKGRLAKKTMELLAGCGIRCPEMEDDSTRKLIFRDEERKLAFFLAKGPDVPTYVEYKAADLGIVGADTILEENRSVCEVLDLGFGKCRMCVCGRPEAAELLKHREMIRVATKYPGIARDHFYNSRAQTAALIKLNGSVELGPIVGLADVIVDIVETGSTLRENGLEVLEEIMPLSARVIANPVSMQLKGKRMKELLRAMKKGTSG